VGAENETVCAQCRRMPRIARLTAAALALARAHGGDLACKNPSNVNALCIEN
jgi:hypothetical protein